MAKKKKQKAPAESPPLDATQLLHRKEMEYSNFMGFLRLYIKQLQRHLVTGLLVWVPLFITLWVAYWVLSKISAGIDGLMGRVQLYVHQLVVRFPALEFLDAFNYNFVMGFLLMMLLFLTTGFFARYLIGKRIIAAAEQIVRAIPLINKVYIAVQQIRDVFVNREGSVFQEVVILEYPRKGIRAVGFVTSDEHGIIQESAGDDLVAVFVPTTPNPTSGFLLYVPRSELIGLDISVEDAMKLIVSGGAYIPEKIVVLPAPGHDV